MIRALDPLESYFATMNRHVPTHFVMAAAFTYVLQDQRWDEVFRALQQRHLLLRAKIRHDASGQLVFEEDELSTVIPITIQLRKTAEDWKHCYAEQVRQPFAEQGSPLIRVVVLRDESHTDVVIACHHTVSDAMGVVFLLRDLLTTLHGSELPPISQQISLSTEQLWKERRPDLTPLDLPQPAPSAAREYLQDPGLPEVQSTTLSEQHTSLLRSRAAQEKVSLHATICAAAILAGARHNAAWRTTPVRLATPVDLRSRLDVGETFSLALTAFGHSHQYVESADLWTFAAEIHTVLLASTTDAALLAASKALGALTQAGNGADVLPLLIAFSPAYDLMVSNLRVLPLELPSTPLRLNAVWGPTTLQQFYGQQSLGVSTYAGRLHLTYVSYNSIPGLLQELKRVLTTEL